MNIARPLGVLTPTLDSPVLQVLAGTNAPLPLSEVHRLAGTGSVSGVRKVLLRLVGTGLVWQVPGGFVLNRDHVAAEAVLALANARTTLWQRIRAHVADWSSQPTLVGAFGSTVRGDGDANSDVDLLVVGPAAVTAAVGDLAEAVQRWTGNECHVVALSPADVRRMRAAHEPILRSWADELVVLAGDRSVLGAGPASS